MTRSAFTDRYELFRQALVDARQQSGLTQSEVADRLERPQSFVSKYERGERRLDVVEFLEVAEAIGVDPSKIIMSIQQPRPAGSKRSK